MNKLRKSINMLSLTVPLIFTGSIIGTSCQDQTDSKKYEAPQDQIYNDVVDGKETHEFNYDGLIITGIGFAAVGAAAYALRNNEMLDPNQEIDPETYEEDY